MYPISDKPCEFEQGQFLSKGLCSPKTENLLRNRNDCINPIWSGKEEILKTLNNLILSLCEVSTWLEFNNPGRKKDMPNAN